VPEQVGRLAARHQISLELADGSAGLDHFRQFRAGHTLRLDQQPLVIAV
jgi:hypothetical protein